MTQWVKNPPAAAQVIAQVWVGSPLPTHGLKDPQLRLGLKTLVQGLPYAIGMANK